MVAKNSAQAIVSAIGLFIVVSFLTACASSETPPAQPEGYTTTLRDADDRTVSVRVWPPGSACQTCDAIVFSHGNNLAFDQYDVLVEPWAAAGYLVIAPLHVDSESHPDREQFVREQVFQARLRDIDAIIAALVARDPLAML